MLLFSRGTGVWDMLHSLVKSLVSLSCSFLGVRLGQLPEQADVHQSQGGGNTGQEDNQHQQECDNAPVAFRRSGSAGLVGVLRDSGIGMGVFVHN